MVGTSVHLAQGDRVELHLSFILLVVGTVNERFLRLPRESDDIPSEYTLHGLHERHGAENALLGELTFQAPRVRYDRQYAIASRTPPLWERLRSAETDGSTQSEVLKQVIA